MFPRPASVRLLSQAAALEIRSVVPEKLRSPERLSQVLLKPALPPASPGHVGLALGLCGRLFLQTPLTVFLAPRPIQIGS
jgi:hypothetical protein